MKKHDIYIKEKEIVGEVLKKVEKLKKKSSCLIFFDRESINYLFVLFFNFQNMQN